MLSLVQAIVLGALQGVSELFPISSLGHTVIVPTLLNWKIDQRDPLFLSFIVATHFATALVLLGFFYKDWVRIIRAMIHSLFVVQLTLKDSYARLGWLLALATIPAGILGLILQDRLRELFAAPATVAVLLCLNGILLFGAEWLRRRSVADSSAADSTDSSQSDIRISKLTWIQSFYVGLMQCLALLPGFSRTGATLSGGLMQGLSHEDAARFSFLLATPIIFAASALKLPALRHADLHTLEYMFVGAICAALGAYFSIRYLSRYFKTNTLMPFAIYCIVAGVVSLFVLH